MTHVVICKNMTKKQLVMLAFLAINFTINPNISIAEPSYRF